MTNLFNFRAKWYANVAQIFARQYAYVIDPIETIRIWADDEDLVWC